MTARQTGDRNQPPKEVADAAIRLDPSLLFKSYVSEWSKTLEVVEDRVARLTKSSKEIILLDQRLDEMRESWDRLWGQVRELESQFREIGGKIGHGAEDFPALSEADRTINTMRNELHRIEVSTPSINDIRKSCAETFARNWNEVKGFLDDLCDDVGAALRKPGIQESMTEAKRDYLDHLMRTLQKEMDRPSSECGADAVGQLRIRARLLAESIGELGRAFSSSTTHTTPQRHEKTTSLAVDSNVDAPTGPRRWIKRDPIAACRKRWAIESDIPAMLKIEELCFDSPWTAKDIKGNLRQRNIIGQVVESPDGVVRGFMVYQLEHRKIEILNLAIDPEFQGRGLGRQLVEVLKDKLDDGRRAEISLVIREKNVDGQLFFRSLGFRAVKTVDNFYRDVDEQAYVMSCRFSPKPS